MGVYYYLCCDPHAKAERFERGVDRAYALWVFVREHHRCPLRVVNDHDMDPPDYVYKGKDGPDS